MITGQFTPILIVDSIETDLGFWENRLGYRVETRVPHGERLGFVILKQGQSEVMLHTRESLAADLPTVLSELSSGSVLLYADVPSLETVIRGIGDAEVVVPRRKTFYGADEIWIRLPSRHVVGFAHFPNRTEETN